MHLSGLSRDEGVEFFKKRKIDLAGNNSEEYCSRIVDLTKGHPWWLGLIAGQVLSGQDTIKQFVDKQKKGESTVSIKNYFKDIWKQLNKEQQRVLRYLVEAPRPLSEGEICNDVVDFSFKRAKKELKRLQRLGLLEMHEGSSPEEIIFQVHPLVREFVHESFSASLQRPYVIRVLYLFLPRAFIKPLFGDCSILDNFSYDLLPFYL